MILFGKPIWMFRNNRIQANNQLLENRGKTLGEDINPHQKLTGVGSWKYDAQKDRIYWSEEISRIYGIDPQDLKKDLKSFLLLIHPNDRLKVLDGVMGCLEGKGYQIEYHIPQRNGGDKLVQSKGVPLFGEDQRPVGILGTAQAV